MKNITSLLAKLNDHYLDENTVTKAIKRPVKGSFCCWEGGRSLTTFRAVETLLVGRGIPPQSYTAELILFMEKSFAGKYKKGSRHHYQRISASPNWREGDSLSEKLTRCKDKETFKGRFDRIGTTAIRRQRHFQDFEPSIDDFKGRMYLRLIDTKRGFSVFYRNDPMADAFIWEAVALRQENPMQGKGKVGSDLTGKPDTVYLQNPKPLLYTGINQGIQPATTKGNSLTLVVSHPTGNTKKPTPEGIDSKGKGQSVLAPIDALSVHSLWRGAVLLRHPEMCISAIISGKTKGQVKMVLAKFAEQLPEEDVGDFFHAVVDKWISVSKELRSDHGVWQKLGSYPEINQLLSHSDHILTWYRRVLAEREKMLNRKSLSQVTKASTLVAINCTEHVAEEIPDDNDIASLEYVKKLMSSSNNNLSIII